MITTLEPFFDYSQLNNYIVHLNMDKSSNPNGKIWIFWNAGVDCNILEADEQYITCVLQHVEYKEKLMTSFIYSKCKDHLRRSLHDRLIHFSNMNIPWCTIGILIYYIHL